MATPTRPDLVLLDVNETLSDLTPLRAAFAEAGLAEHDVEPWFAGVLRDGFALAVTGRSAGFAEIATDALEGRLDAIGADDARAAAEQVMGTFTRLRPHPDVVPGLLGLAELGCRVVTLSNGSTGVARSLLGETAAASAVEDYLSVEDAPLWKPAPEAYGYALERTGVEPGAAMLVAVHPWDLAGARAAGLRTAWINRSVARYPSYFPAPDLEAASFTDLADMMA